MSLQPPMKGLVLGFLLKTTLVAVSTNGVNVRTMAKALVPTVMSQRDDFENYVFMDKTSIGKAEGELFPDVGPHLQVSQCAIFFFFLVKPVSTCFIRS